MAALMSWMPDMVTIASDLAFVPESRQPECEWNGKTLAHCGDRLLELDVNRWSRSLATNWTIPLTAAVLYLIGIPALKAMVKRRGKFDVKNFAFYWNVFLSVFSWCGVFACAPVLLSELWGEGLYFATCAPAEWYGMGVSGLFILFFILSKLAELVDTVLLILSGKPVILLHWWHHTTVMLYCWHSYSTQISTGVWFATMNYFVHSIMYGYFAATQTSARKLVIPFAMYITLLQLVQMLVGMWITIKAVLYQMDGLECNVNKTNSVLGLTMYFSYFVLFGKLFVDHYLLGKKSAAAGQPKAKKEASVVRAVSSKVLQTIDTDDEDESAPAKRSAVNADQPSKDSAKQRTTSSKSVTQRIALAEGLPSDSSDADDEQKKAK